MIEIITSFALRFYGLMAATLVISLLIGWGEMALFSGVYSVIGALLWMVEDINKETLVLRGRLKLLLGFILSTLLYPLLVIYLVYLVKDIINFAIPGIMYFVSSIALSVIFLIKIR